MNCSADIVTSTNTFNNMRDEWNELLWQSHQNSPFLTWEWLFTWWRCYGRTSNLFIIAVRNTAGRLLGIAPFRLTRKRFFAIRHKTVLEFIGTGGDVTTEYLSVIIRRKYEKIVTRTLLDTIFADDSWEEAQLFHFFRESAALAYMKEYLAMHGVTYINDKYSICPFAVLPGTLDGYFSDKSVNFRKKMKEYARVAARDLNLHVQAYRSDEELSKGMSTLNKLHKARWGRKSRAFKTKEYIHFHHLVSQLFLKQGCLRLFSIMDDVTPMASIYCFFYNGIYYYYQSGRDLNYSRYRPGYLMLLTMIEEAIKEHATQFDFLTGNEHYKSRFANHKRETVVLSFRNERMQLNPS